MNTLNDLSTMISNVDTMQKKTVSLEDKVPYGFGIDTDSNYGYIKNGEDTVNTFKDIDNITSNSYNMTHGNNITYCTVKTGRVLFEDMFPVFTSFFKGNSNEENTQSYTYSYNATSGYFQQTSGTNCFYPTVVKMYYID